MSDTDDHERDLYRPLTPSRREQLMERVREAREALEVGTTKENESK
jgi:transcription initiation factor IIE alpha subunit